MNERVDPLWSALALLIAAAAMAGISLITGAGLIHVSTTLNKPAPVVLLVLVLLPTVALATFSSPRIAVAAVFAAFIAGPSPTKAAIFFFAALVVLSRIAVGKTPIAWSPTLWWAVALFSWTIFALGSSIEPVLATKSVAVLFAGILFATVVLAACRTMNDVRWILGAFVVLSTILVAKALTHAGQLQAIGAGTQVNNRLQGDFGSPNQLGSFCDLGAFVAVGLAFGARSRLARFAATLAFGILLTGLTFSLSRGAWIGAVLALVYLLFALREARAVAIAIGVPMIVVAWLIGSFAPGNTQIQVITKRVGALTFASPYDDRRQIWAEAIREMKAKPWLGYGPGDFPVSSLRTGSDTSSVYALHAHNLWLTWGAETGIPAVAIIVGLTAAVGFAARRATRGANKRGDREDRAIVVGVTAALITVLGQGLVDYTLRNVVIFTALWGLIGALLVARREAYHVLETPESAEPVRAPHRILEQTRAGLIPRARVEHVAETNGDPHGDYDPRDLPEKHDERLERRLAEQSEALQARRSRLRQLRDALTEREREIEGRDQTLARQAAEVERERGRHEEIAARLTEVEAREASVTQRERQLAERAERLDSRARDLAARVRELDARAADRPEP